MDISKNHKIKARLRQKIYKSSFLLIGLTLLFSSLVPVFATNVLALGQTTLIINDTVTSSLMSLPKNFSDKIDLTYQGSKQTFNSTNVFSSSNKSDTFKFTITRFNYGTSSGPLKPGSYIIQSEDDNDQKSVDIQNGSTVNVNLAGQYPPVSHAVAPLASNNIQIEVFDTVTLNGTPPTPFSDTISIKGPNGSNQKTETINSIAPNATSVQFNAIFHTVTATVSSLNSFSPTSQTSNLSPNTPYQVTSSLSHQTQTAAPAQGGSLVTVDLNSTYKTSGSLQNTCETSGTALPWLICPLITGLSGASKGIYDTLIQPLLNVPPINISPQNAIYQVWSNFRIYGDVVLVVTLLVMVFGEAIGGGLVSAYTVKKVLPRLLVAAILLNLSIYLVAMAVDITNIIGKDIGQLIELPFAHVQVMLNGTTKETISGAAKFGGALSVILGGLVVLAGVGAIFALGFMPLFLLIVLLPVLLAFIAILVTLVIRQALIVLLVFVSPIAFALYCLPNTEKYFKQWWSLLAKTLMVYPIISVIFAMSTVSAITVYEASTTSSSPVSAVIGSLLAILGAVIPLFLIPFSFKISGGVLGSIYGLANNLGKKAHEKIKGNPNDPDSLANRLKRRSAANMAERGFSSRAVGARLNPTNYLSRNRRQNLRGQLDRIKLDYQDLYGRQGMSEHAFNRLKDDSDVMTDFVDYAKTSDSLSAAHQEYGSTMSTLNKQLKDKEINSQEYATQKSAADRKLRVRLAAAAGADVIRKNPYLARRFLMNQTTIKYGVTEYGDEGAKKISGVMQRIAGDNDSVKQSLYNEFNFMAKNSQRPDLAGFQTDGTFSLQKGYDSQNLPQIASSPPQVVKAFGDSFLNEFKRAKATLSVEQDARKQNELKEAIVKLGRNYKEFKIMLANQPNGDVRNAIVNTMSGFEQENIADILHDNRIDGQTLDDLSNVGLRTYDQRIANQNQAEQYYNPPPAENPPS